MGLPPLPERIARLHALRWQALIQKQGFDGEHLKWHDSPERRHRAAAPSYSLLPPPLTPITAPGPRPKTTFYGEGGNEVSYQEWHKLQLVRWKTRESDPAVIDTIGTSETIRLAETRFREIIDDQILMWAVNNGTYEQFCEWGTPIALTIIGEIRKLWTGEWHSEWFERACRARVEQSLEKLFDEAKERVLKFEIQHLENSHLSLGTIVVSGGNLKLAAEVEQSSGPVPSLCTGGAPISQRPAALQEQHMVAATEPDGAPNSSSNKAKTFEWRVQTPDLKTDQDAHRVAIQEESRRRLEELAQSLISSAADVSTVEAELSSRAALILDEMYWDILSGPPLSESTSDALARGIQQDLDSKTIVEVDEDGNRSPARPEIQALFAARDEWDHRVGFVMPNTKVALREELRQVLLRDMTYFVGKARLRRSSMRADSDDAAATDVSDSEVLPSSSAPHDFSTEESRTQAIADYLAHWSENGYPDCSEASLARAARVHPGDLTRWKQAKLPPASSKSKRIEKVIRDNESPVPLPPRPNGQP